MHKNNYVVITIVDSFLFAGAKKVYAVEASQSADLARLLVEANGYSDRIEVIQAKLEDVNLPEKVDIIISEPIGFLLGEALFLHWYCYHFNVFIAVLSITHNFLATIVHRIK